MRISDWSSDVCSSDLRAKHWLSVGAQPSDRVARFLDAAGIKERAARNNPNKAAPGEKAKERAEEKATKLAEAEEAAAAAAAAPAPERSEEHTSELQSLMRISYAVFCLKKQKNNQRQ